MPKACREMGLGIATFPVSQKRSRLFLPQGQHLGMKPVARGCHPLRHSLPARSPGHNTIDVQVTAQDSVTQKTYSVAVKRLTYLEAWRRLHFNSIDNSGNAADNSTPQNDGLPNLLKFATAMNPEVNGVSPTGIVKNGSTLEFTYPRSVEAKAECTFIVEWSETLLAGSWSAAGVSEHILSTTSTLEQVKASLPAGSLGRRFVRLRVTNP
jgi:hypothetical protein